jgi:nitroreductase
VVVDDRDKLNAIMEAHPYTRMLAEAPMAIVVCGDTSISESYWDQDCSAPTENILLAARALDLGTVWCGVYPREARVKAVSALFDLPETIVPLNVIALGHPAEEKGRVDRYKESRIHQNTW